MIDVRVPAHLHAALADPLAVRGFRPVTGAGAATMFTMGRDRPISGRWLALVDDEDAAVSALDAGADDVATAGTGPALLAARIARLARAATVRVGGLEIDTVARVAWRDGRRLNLLPREYAVLLQLARWPDMLMTRSALRTAVWGREFDPGTNVIEVHVSRLRAQLDRNAPPMLLTERGRGYRLVSDPGDCGGRARVLASLHE